MGTFGLNQRHVTGYSPICSLQDRFNCSGFKFGCCVAYNPLNPSGEYCYGRNGTTPDWVPRICPRCPKPATARMCTDLIYSTVQRNLGGLFGDQLLLHVSDRHGCHACHCVSFH